MLSQAQRRGDELEFLGPHQPGLYNVGPGSWEQAVQYAARAITAPACARPLSRANGLGERARASRPVKSLGQDAALLGLCVSCVPLTRQATPPPTTAEEQHRAMTRDARLMGSLSSFSPPPSPLPAMAYEATPEKPVAQKWRECRPQSLSGALPKSLNWSVTQFLHC